MALASGTHVGPYEIAGAIGAGGWERFTVPMIRS